MAITQSWSQGELDAAKSFFGANPTGDQIAQKAQQYGFSATQFADLYSQSTGGDYNAALGTINNWQQSTGNTLAGTYKPQGVDPVVTQQPNAQSWNTTAAVTAQQPAQQVATYAAPKNEYGWSAEELSAANDFFNAGVGGDAIYQKARQYGLSADQLANLYATSTGRDQASASSYINNWLQSNNKYFPGGFVRSPVADPYQTPYKPEQGMLFNPKNSVASARTEDWMVTPNQTVQGQLQGLLSQNNPLVQMAQTQGLEAAQQRGLLNSSLGAEAGALAHYQYAMPIAQADAQLYSNAARTNAENRTQMNQVNAQAENQYNLSDFNAQNELKRMEAAQKLNLSNLNTQQANQVRTNYVSQMNAIQQSMNSFINSVQASNDITPEAKSELIANYQNVQFPNMINMTNAVYSNMPEWQSEWTTFPPTIG